MSSQPMRKGAIRDFISNLSPWELLYLRHHVQITPVVLAGLEALPLDVLADLARDYLSLQDILACRLVCSAWNRAWTQEYITATLCRRFFPGLVELNAGTEQHDIQRLFMKQANKRLAWITPPKEDIIKWEVGGEGSGFVCNEDPPWTGHSTTVSRCIYAQGLLAWTDDGNWFMIDDLRSRTRQRCTLGNPATTRSLARVLAISRQLLVLDNPIPALLSRHPSKTLTIYHLQHKAWKKIHLPGLPFRVIVEGEHIGIVTRAKTLLVASWGGDTSALEVPYDQLELPNTKLLLGGVPKMLQSPLDPTIACAVWAIEDQRTDHRICTFVLIKFQNGKAVQRMETSVEKPSEQSNFESRWEISLPCRKSDAHGSFMLGLVRGHSTACNPDPLDRICYCHENGGPWRTWRAVYFNVLTGAFWQHRYQHPKFLRFRGPEAPHSTQRILHTFAHTSPWNNDLFVVLYIRIPYDGHEYVIMQKLSPCLDQVPGPQTHGFADPGILVNCQYSEFEDITQVFADDERVIVVGPGHLHVWSPSGSGAAHEEHAGDANAVDGSIDDVVYLEDLPQVTCPLLPPP